MEVVMVTHRSRLQFTFPFYCRLSMQSRPAAISFSNRLGIIRRTSHLADTLALHIDPFSLKLMIWWFHYESVA